MLTGGMQGVIGKGGISPASQHLHRAVSYRDNVHRNSKTLSRDYYSQESRSYQELV
jgi:hypothetical protein